MKNTRPSHPGESGAHGAECEALMVEVLHHVLKALALFAQQIASVVQLIFEWVKRCQKLS